MSHTGTSISMHICSFVAAVLGLVCEYSCVVQSDPVKNFAFVNNV